MYELRRTEADPGDGLKTGGVAEFTGVRDAALHMRFSGEFGNWTSWRAQNPKVEVLNWTGISTLGSSNLRLPLSAVRLKVE